MTYNYLAIYTREQSTRTLAMRANFLTKISKALNPWRTVHEDDKLIVLDQPDASRNAKVHRLTHDKGIILGYLFTPKPDGSNTEPSLQAPQMLSESDSRQIVDSKGLYLNQKFWGSYIAFISGQNEWHIIRGPFSNMHCFCVEMGGLFIFFSDVRVLRLIDRCYFSVDWHFAAQFLKYTAPWTASTSIKGLLSLQHSQAFTVSPKRLDNWRFFDIENVYRGPLHTSTADLMNKLRNITFSTVESWSRVIPGALVHLSGGFDSSLLTGCLSRSRNIPNVSCLTYFYDANSYNDERAYARLTAHRAGFELLEHELQPDSFDFSIYEHLSLIPDPVPINPDWRMPIRTQSIMDHKGLTAVLSGTGGDGIFGAYRGNMAAMDYAFEHGFNASSLKVAMRSAEVSNTSLWKALSAMVAAKFGHDGEYSAWLHDPESNWGINPEMARYIDEHRIIAPWDNGAKPIPPAKKLQLLEVMLILHHYSLADDLPVLEEIRPFLSQPIAEAWVEVPFYLLQYDGRERGLARKAFSDCLAPEVRLRQLKTVGGAAFDEAIKSNRRFFAEFLLDGVLMKQKILDRSALERGLSGPAEMTPTNYARLLLLAGAEAWARSWARS